MKMDTTKQRGDRGEDLALQHLLRQGYRLLARNVRFGRRELDLVMEDHGVTVFVEVKARGSSRFGTPGEAVTAAKQRNLHQAAEAYLARAGLLDAPARFDVAEVDLLTGSVRVLVNAFGQ